MATAAMGEVIQHLRRTVLLRDGVGLTDRQLLEDYVSRRDEAALEALVLRHGPMVWCVCRRVLANQHDAEDAFQATFLVFVRKAASIASRELLANWLYGVAYQTSRKARATAAKRQARERQVTEMPEPALEQQAVDDLQPLLDQELSQLADKYRKVLVLCDLEGQTRKEAARQLRCPEGTVASRLATARSMLAKRLARHGVTVTGGTLAAVFSQEMASASVPAQVVSSTIKAAIMFAAGTGTMGAISVKVATIAEGVLKNMLFTKLANITAITVAIAVVIGIGVQLLGHKAVSGQQKESDIRLQVNRGDARDADLSKDARELQGEWKLIAFEREGSDLSEGLKDAVVTFKGEEMTIRLDSDREAKKSKFMLIPKESPKGIDVTPDYGVFKGKQIAGIYSLEKGRLRICIIERDDRGRNEKIRPKEFKTEANDGLALITLEKVKRDPLKEKPAKQKNEKQAVIAWGKEVGGLQARISLRPGEKRVYHHGEVITLVVRVRNVGKKTVKFEYVRQFLDENLPTVTNAADGKTVPQHRLAMLGEHFPVEVSLEPGKEIELESRLPLRYELRPDGKAKQITKERSLFVGTGKVSLQYERVFGNSSVGAINLDPALSQLGTGKLELEVKPDPPPADEKKPKQKQDGDLTAWGKEVGGLQAGLGLRPSQKRIVHHGEVVTLVVRVRNVGKESVKFEYVRQFLDENPPTVTNAADGKTVPQHRLSMLGFHSPVEVSLEPGKEIELESRLPLRYELRPVNGKAKQITKEGPLFVGTGKVSIQYERVFGSSSAGTIKLDAALSKLGTGKLELEVK
jgi:RNA polymerase sigma factor (sigma-70 family)